ncbi:MAG TPA: sigma-70 family RNA polymerase sigma factor [Terriglobales bacterium]|nr:sigma-70 family RNA polymerase sigma factor [Terriglobales bacterium]
MDSSKSAGAVGEAVPALSSQVFSTGRRSKGADRLVCLIEKVSRFPVHATHSISPTGHRRSSHAALKHPSLSLALSPTPSLTIVPEDDHRPASPVLHCLPLSNTRGKLLQFDSFNEAYVEWLRAGDFRTQEHFRVYFTALIHVKLRSRLRSREAIEDVRQETFARFYVALREGKIIHPERLGSFVNSICNNVLLEHYRTAARHGVYSKNNDNDSDDDQQKELPSPVLDPLAMFTAQEIQQKVREIIDQLPERDRRLLREVFLEERDKDEVCRDFGVDREYLRVLLYRAKQLFKALYLKNNDAPETTSA